MGPYGLHIQHRVIVSCYVYGPVRPGQGLQVTTPLANILHPPSPKKLISNNKEPPLVMSMGPYGLHKGFK